MTFFPEMYRYFDREGIPGARGWREGHLQLPGLSNSAHFLNLRLVNVIPYAFGRRRKECAHGTGDDGLMDRARIFHFKISAGESAAAVPLDLPLKTDR